MRILLFLMTNAAIFAVISIVFNLLGINGILDQQGVNLDLNSLLVMSGVIGISGRFKKLFMSHPPLEERIAPLQNRG